MKIMPFYSGSRDVLLHPCLCRKVVWLLLVTTSVTIHFTLMYTGMTLTSNRFVGKNAEEQQLLAQFSRDGNDLLRSAVKKVRQNIILTLTKDKKETGRSKGAILPIEQRHILILSFHRSGSTFLFDLLGSFPGTYSAFEPLQFHLKNNFSFRQDDNFEIKTNLLRDFFLCNLDAPQINPGYFFMMKDDPQYIDRNIFKACVTERNVSLCYDPRFHRAICKAMPITLLKTVRIGAEAIPILLSEEQLNLKIIVLVRDPRPVMMSRNKAVFCDGHVCKEADTVCADISRTAELASTLRELHPQRVFLLRFEDLLEDMVNVTRSVLDFLDLPFTWSIKEFLATHTTLNTAAAIIASRNPYTTFRDSADEKTAWRTENNFAVVDGIQRICKGLIQQLNYRYFEDIHEYYNLDLSSTLKSAW